MRFKYPFKLYTIGLLINLAFIIYGAMIVYQITIVEGHHYIFGIIYFVVVVTVISTFFTYISSYVGRYIDITSQHIKVVDAKNVQVMRRDEISYIIEANHLQFLKLFNVIHIFTRDHRYFYITSDINRYKQFKEEIKARYEDCYLTRSKLVIGNPEITKQMLLKGSDYNKLFK